MGVALIALGIKDSSLMDCRRIASGVGATFIGSPLMDFVVDGPTAEGRADGTGERKGTRPAACLILR